MGEVVEFNPPGKQGNPLETLAKNAGVDFRPPWTLHVPIQLKQHTHFKLALCSCFQHVGLRLQGGQIGGFNFYPG